MTFSLSRSGRITGHPAGTAAANSRPTVHLINPLDCIGGSELRTLQLYDLLRPQARVQLWSSGLPLPAYAEKYPIQRLSSRHLRLPYSGTFVLIGDYDSFRWVAATFPRRLIVVQNTFPPRSLVNHRGWITRLGTRQVEVVYPSAIHAARVGIPGVVQVSPIALGQFQPAERPDRTFVVGKLSRDQPGKHHHEDPELFARLAAEGCRVHLIGANCLKNRLPKHPEIVRFEITQEPEAFYRGLDAFFYRTRPDLMEAFGRVVLEAMACGLPVVCDEGVGASELIRSGENGFVISTTTEAEQVLLRLRDDKALRRRVGMAARRTAEQVLSPARMQELVDFYLR